MWFICLFLSTHRDERRREMKIVFSKTKNGVPILKQDDIDACAEVLIKKFKPELLTSPAATPVESFIESFLGLKIDYANLSEDDSILGMITFNDGVVDVFDDDKRKQKISVKRGTILIDNSLTAEDQNGRCRFTLGHEPGHWIFHKHMYSISDNITKLANLPVASCFKCKNRNVGRIIMDIGFTTAEEWKEWQADNFSSALLMPKSSVNMLMERYLKDVDMTKEEFFDSNIFDVYPEANYIITSLAQVFEVSFLAIEVRLNKLGYISDKAIKFLCA